MKKILKNNKGFTLIEIVVTIIIIAILAAILVPSMLSWIDNANQKTVISAADTIRNTVAAEVLEVYKDGDDVDGTPATNTAAYDQAFWDAVNTKVGVTLQYTDSTADNYVMFTVVSGDVTELTYSDGDWTAVFENNSWTCTKN